MQSTPIRAVCRSIELKNFTILLLVIINQLKLLLVVAKIIFELLIVADEIDNLQIQLIITTKLIQLDEILVHRERLDDTFKFR